MLADKLHRTTAFFDAEPKLDLSRLPNMDATISEHDAWQATIAMRWPGGDVRCPKCGHAKVYTLAERKKFTCASPACRHRFSALSGTAFASFKKGYVGLLAMLAHDGPGHKSGASTSKTAYDVQRRKIANS